MCPQSLETFVDTSMTEMSLVTVDTSMTEMSLVTVNTSMTEMSLMTVDTSMNEMSLVTVAKILWNNQGASYQTKSVLLIVKIYVTA
jgi:hypothetical protein